MPKPVTELRLGLCCIFRDQAIKFGTTTVTAIQKLNRRDALLKLSRLCLDNASALMAALEFCQKSGYIGSFRINSQILPLKTHTTVGYALDDLPDADEIRRRFKSCGEFCKTNHLRTSFHPDQFVVLNSPRPDVVAASIRELEYQAEVAEWVQADVVNIHGGGAYGDKPAALRELAKNLARLSSRVRERLTLENDDKVYSPSELLPVCRAEGIPLVYDVHHHRCHRDELSIEEATRLSIETWDREPLFHISSPLEGWDGPKPSRHHDMIDIADFPQCWRGLKLTVEVEAKAKEVAVRQLYEQLHQTDLGDKSGAWVAYLLRCADQSLYTGITNDIDRRMEQHRDGKASRYTRSHLPVQLVYQEPCADRSTALKREAAIKALTKAQKEALIRSTPQS